jgi:hypothetical protein
MQNDKKYLQFDLRFLDEVKRSDAEALAKSRYKINWRSVAAYGGRNAAMIGGFTIFVIICANSGDKSTSSHGISSPPITSAPVYLQPTTNNEGMVRNSQFRCSSYDSAQANKLSPVGEGDLNIQQQELEGRRDALDRLKSRINLSSVGPASSQPDIDAYNALVDQYNMQLTSLKNDMKAYQARTDQFNAQVEAHNNYLLSHCRSGG